MSDVEPVYGPPSGPQPWVIDSRGWVTLALFVLAFADLMLTAFVPNLSKDDLFKTISQGIVLTGLVNLSLSFYYGASQQSHTPPATPPEKDTAS